MLDCHTADADAGSGKPPMGWARAAAFLLFASFACHPHSGKTLPNYQSDCLAYPLDALPGIGESLEDDEGGRSHIRVSADGRFAILSDVTGRLIGWRRGQSSAVFLPSGTIVSPITEYMAAYVGNGGFVGRVDLATGELSHYFESTPLATKVNAFSLDETRRFVTLTKCPTCGQPEVIDDCILAKGSEADSCGGQFPRPPSQVSPVWSWHPTPVVESSNGAQVADRVLHYVVEDAKGASVVRGCPLGTGECSDLLLTAERVDLAGAYALIWSKDQHSVRIKRLHGEGQVEVLLTDDCEEALRDACFGIEQVEGRRILLRRGRPGPLDWTWAIVNAETGIIEWSTKRKIAAAAVLSDGQVLLAEKRGICSSMIPDEMPAPRLSVPERAPSVPEGGQDGLVKRGKGSR